MDNFPGWENLRHELEVPGIIMNESFHCYNHNGNDDSYDEGDDDDKD